MVNFINETRCRLNFAELTVHNFTSNTNHHTKKSTVKSY